MRKMKRVAKKIKKEGVVEVIKEYVYHAIAITGIYIVSLVQPGQPIKENSKGMN